MEATKASSSCAYAVAVVPLATFDTCVSTQFDPSAQPGSSTPPGSPAPLNPELVNQMTINAFSAFGLSGNASSLFPTWYLDLGATNHMTSSPTTLPNIVPYSDNLIAQTTDGENLSIATIGDASGLLPLINVFMSPRLTTNLVSDGQLIENNRTVSFSTSGCVVQDQKSGEVLVMWPRREDFFPFLLLLRINQ